MLRYVSYLKATSKNTGYHGEEASLSSFQVFGTFTREFESNRQSIGL